MDDSHGSDMSDDKMRILARRSSTLAAPILVVAVIVPPTIPQPAVAPIVALVAPIALPPAVPHLFLSIQTLSG